MLKLPENVPDEKTIEERFQVVPEFNSKCFDLFRSWTSRAKWQFPNWEPDVKHEQEILDHVKECFCEGVKATFKQQDSEEAKLPGFLTGFFSGFVQGSLGSGWSTRYLPKPDCYKEVLWLKSLHHYLKLPVDAMQHLNRLYTVYDQSDMILKPEQGTITDEDVALYHIFADINFDDNKKALLKFLDKLERKHIKKLVNKFSRVEVRDVLEIFESKDLEFMLTGESN